jgi:carbon-monoxide dehydrogenase medium subunit
MKPPPFEYLAPGSLSEALGAKEQYGYDGTLLAGGQSLVPAMNYRLARPEVLIDLNRVPELSYIRLSEDGELRIGAMTRQWQLEKDPQVARAAPLLFEAIPHVAHPQIRNRGTLGGSLSHADPAAELPVVARALDARFLVRRVIGDRWISAADFFLGIFTTDLDPEEILVEVAFPPMPPGSGWAFMEFARRQGDYALAGLAALVTLAEDGVCRSVRLVYLNAGEVPISAAHAEQYLKGYPVSENNIRSAAQAAVAELEPQGNIHASADYQQHLARVLTERALVLAFERARAQWIENGEGG